MTVQSRRLFGCVFGLVGASSEEGGRRRGRGTGRKPLKGIADPDRYKDRILQVELRYLASGLMRRAAEHLILCSDGSAPGLRKTVRNRATGVAAHQQVGVRT